MQNIFYVYLHRFPNGVLYVGKGSNGRHVELCNRNQYWQSLKKKYGDPAIRIVANNLCEKNAFAAETRTILALKNKGKTLCNLTNGGGGVAGYVWPKEKTQGAKNHNYDPVVREFKNHKTGERFTGTKWELKCTFNLAQSGVSQMVSGKINAFHGWLPVDREYLGKASGSRNKYFNPTIYKFLIVATSKVVESTQHDFKKQNPHIGHSGLSAICRGVLKSTKGIRCLNPRVSD